MIDYKTIAESNSFIVLDKYTKEWHVAENYQSESDLENELIQTTMVSTSKLRLILHTSECHFSAACLARQPFCEHKL
ncbi:hypothetical protein J2R62_16595 [Plesiomonas shigelloides]|uniref:Uncharacterized protein n=1 Tax=Plesiomonas shigelloides TaxID=703 RepID=A0A8I2B741_PLESH|nr:hypothetical protein [Plesiomonas shigelloides]MBO1109797.1 hypothetical protein [Plesiomonas shigelloides]